MSVKITLEIGHEASVRTKRTQEGFTHDWEVFVRGADGVNIQHYVEKVVFNLHETFPKPRRVVKEPPYSLKESGYAGFNLPIEIYVKNKDEPKKIRFNYDLSLQPSGPPLSKAQREKFTFKDVSDEFKHKLLKGGGMVVSSSGLSDGDTKGSLEKQQQLLNKPKLGGSQEFKKHKSKIDDPRDSSLSFNSVFGTPIKRTKTPEPKIFVREVPKKEKDKERKNKSPNKERDKEKEKKEEKRDKDERKKEKNKERSSKEHDRAGKDKKRDKSPKREKSASPGLRRSSPKRLDVRPSSPSELKAKEKDEKRKEKERDKEKYKKREKEYENKHKDKEKEREKEKEYKTKADPKPTTNLVRDIEASPSFPTIPTPTSVKVEKKDKERTPKESAIKSDPVVVDIDKPQVRMEEKKDREKHKHKKKDKERDKDKEKRDKSSHKAKSEKKANSATYEQSNSLFSSPKHEKKKFAIESADNDNSNSSCSSTKDVEALGKPPSPVAPPFVEAKPAPESAAPLPSKPKKDKMKRREKRLEKDVKKRRRRSDLSMDEEEPAAKVAKEESQATSQPDAHPISGLPGEQARDLDKQENPEDYLRILQELQHKIMTLQDNTELQKVVKMIAETGRYEVSARTFDFDLCLLERSTVRRLQEFFSLPS